MEQENHLYNKSLTSDGLACNTGQHFTPKIPNSIAFKNNLRSMFTNSFIYIYIYIYIFSDSVPITTDFHVFLCFCVPVYILVLICVKGVS